MSKTFLFDVDHTLYPYSEAVETEITSLIDAYLVEQMGLNAHEARVKRDEYYHMFGTTLAGLLFYDDIKAQDYLTYKDRFNLDILDRDEAGLEKIRLSNARMIAVTNSHKNHGVRVIEHLGLSEKFNKIYGIEDMGYWGKPFKKSFDIVFEDSQIIPSETVFFEDTIRNLAYPKALGMTTILIRPEKLAASEIPAFVDYYTRNLNDAMEIAHGL